MEHNGADETHKPLKISFCTTCKGRVQHLMQTYPKNRAHCKGDPNVEFVILDYDSGDGLEEWIKTNYQGDIDSGRLRYVKFAPAPHFKMAHAKNLAHLAATGDIVCNLDADNFLSASTALLRKQLREDPDAIIRPHRRGITFIGLASKFHLRKGKATGAGGQIALRRDNFIALGGYNEVVEGWGPDDAELTERAKSRGLHYVEPPIYEIHQVIDHSHEERLRHLSPEAKKKSEATLESFRHRRLGRYVRHVGHMIGLEKVTVPEFAQTSFGEGEVVINFKEHKHLGETVDPDAIRRTIYQHRHPDTHANGHTNGHHNGDENGRY